MPGFKQYQRGQRNMVTEESYAGGMRFTDTPLMEGVCKNLINFDLKDMGQVLTPRAGYQTLYTKELGELTVSHSVHHTGQGILFNTITGDDRAVRYILMDSQDTEDGWFNFVNAKILIEDSFSSDYNDTANKSLIVVPPLLNSIVVGEDTVYDEYLIKRTPRVRTQLLHDMNLTDPQLFNGTKHSAMHTMLSNVALLPVKYTKAAAAPVAVEGYAKLKIYTDGAGYWAALEFITPQEINPTAAVNYGYNMLKTTPYAFTDSVNTGLPAGYILMEGILPYAEEAGTNLKLNAKVGEQVFFKLIAQYPDDAGASKYKFKWEVHEIGSDKVDVYHNHEAANAPTYSYDPDTQDAGVVRAINCTYKQMSVTVTAYALADLTEPIQTMTFANYHIAEDSSASIANLEVKSYALEDATGMTTWKQRVVVWGVPGAENMLFTSDANNPAYFPYPNNCHVFDDPIVACVPYLGDLLVFTTSKLHRLAFLADGSSFTVNVIQEKLFMSTFDKETITIVQNMVFFKNGNYFYMIVPKKSANEPGALQLAPISQSITNLLDHFYSGVSQSFWELYNPINSNVFPELKSSTTRMIMPHDYYNYLDNTAVRNVYKFMLVDVDKTTGLIDRVLLYFDYILNYDTMARTWTSYILQTNDTRLLPYKQSITDTTVYVEVRNIPVSTSYNVYCDFVKPNTLDPQDTFPLGENTLVLERILRNYQYLDTGYREHETQYKKRYREIQFKINNISQKALRFGTEFMLDDMARNELYNYVTHHITDALDEDVGYFYVERIPKEPLTTPGATLLDDEEEVFPEASVVVPSTSFVLQSNCWVLDVSSLSKVTVNKVRFKVSGKGYAPRMVLLSYNDKPYELLSQNWVYRMMNAR